MNKIKKDFSLLSEHWCNLSEAAKVIIVTDRGNNTLANNIKSDIKNECSILLFNNNFELYPLTLLNPYDLIIVLLQINTYAFEGANRFFSPFSKPEGVISKYAFIRLGISKESLLQGLSTPKNLIYEKIDEYNKFSNHKLRVTNHSGTDITLQVEAFSAYSCEITKDGGMAFLPPSETSIHDLTNAANGKIVVDVTVGQLYHYGKLLGNFGLVPSPVTLLVKTGVIIDIYGNEMATELKDKLFSLQPECSQLDEMGQGLSKMTPTGLIGVDESIIETCHFGFGDAGKCGVHLDVVISNPQISIVLSD